ncbi:MAG TPA: hypothetical protein VMQ76_01860 [Terracidiphilus sp.]|jgi:hypothetical protein|nr:hypothetical protein [Terracidiphilus sp.]
MNKVVFDIPEGLLEAAQAAYRRHEKIEPGVFLTVKIAEAILLWIAENAPVPTQEQFQKLPVARHGRFPWPISVMEEWERRMFLAKGSKVPKYRSLT